MENIDLYSKLDEDPKGYILELDLRYPSHLQDIHNDYLLAPEEVVVEADMLSRYALGLAEKLNVNYRSKKPSILIPNFMDKTNYVVHYYIFKH